MGSDKAGVEIGHHLVQQGKLFRVSEAGQSRFESRYSFEIKEAILNFHLDIIILFMHWSILYVGNVS